ncbi:hypothetical protein GWK47_049535 [Chionoecetes opilio]|uniref:Cc8K15.2-like protein n=1 Tax=Chionoecetes opilio TaxID=41210 RepID=A0A8J4YAX3_CHIOP|nr:hypothetical protein GWK47_049535 [Chionoecetes opilio]
MTNRTENLNIPFFLSQVRWLLLANSGGLIGHPEENITGSRLPSKGQVLRKFYFHHGLEKKTKAEAAKETVEEVLGIWEKAGLPTSTLRYNKAKCSKMPLRRHTNEEDRAFLISQSESIDFLHDRTGHCVSEAPEKKWKREEAEVKRKQAAEMEKKIASSSVPSSQVASSSSSSHEKTDGSDVEFKCLSPPKRRAGKKSDMILSKEVTTKLDRFKVSDPAAMAVVVGAVAKATGQNIDNITLSTSFIAAAIGERTERKWPLQRRSNSQRDALCYFTVMPCSCLTSLGDVNAWVERLAIHVTGGDKEYLLEVAKIPQGTGHHMAEAVLKAVSDAGLEARIQGIVFDTTASNTGPNGGACIKIQEGLGRNLLWFACRHHILEVILGDVFKHCYGPSGGPNVPLFVRF